MSANQGIMEKKETAMIAYICAPDATTYLHYTNIHYLETGKYPSLFISNVKKLPEYPILVLDVPLSEERRQRLETYRQMGFTIHVRSMEQPPGI